MSKCFEDLKDKFFFNLNFFLFVKSIMELGFIWRKFIEEKVFIFVKE